MIQPSVVHETFAIERDYPAPPSRVFAAFANPKAKRRWFAEGESPGVKDFTMDFRVGGRESACFLFQGGPEGAPPKGTEIRNDTIYQDIVPEKRIVFAYTMAMGDRRISASLATVELHRSGDGTRLVFTEQAAFFEGGDGAKMREGGWRDLLKKLDDEVRKPA